MLALGGSARAGGGAAPGGSGDRQRAEGRGTIDVAVRGMGDVRYSPQLGHGFRVRGRPR
jgi:hypothetical protein